VDTWDDAGADVAERFDTADSPEWDLLGEHTVEEAMSRRIIAVGHEESVAEAARKMEQAQVHRLLVMEGSSLLGIITTSDVTRAVAESRA
jgi:predicted transcriptional regulator